MAPRRAAPERPAPRPAARPRGRPAKGAREGDVRRELLEVATRLFSERGFAEVGIREIARAARVTPGMISYYFGDKVGLYEAMLDSVFERLLREVQAIAAGPPRDMEPAEAFVHVYIHTIARAPWIPQFMVREVLTKDGPLRKRFAERYASRMAAVAPPLFAHEIESGRLRRDLDPVLALLSLVGMCVFPFLAEPVVGPVLGYRIDEEFPERLIAHTARVFLDGARPPR